MKTFNESTLKEINSYLEYGATQLTPNECNQILDSIGFSVDNSEMSFYYTNSANENIYNAKSIYIIDKVSKESAFNSDFINKNTERLRQLQEFRRNYFVVETKKNKTILWEL